MINPPSGLGNQEVRGISSQPREPRADALRPTGSEPSAGELTGSYDGPAHRELLRRQVAAITGEDISDIRHSDGGVDLARRVVNLKGAAQMLLAWLEAHDVSPPPVPGWEGNQGVSSENASLRPGLHGPDTEAEPSAAMRAIRLALPLLDDDLACFQNDTPPGLWDARGFVCLDDLHCDHHRWMDCESTLKAMLAIRDVLPEDEWADNAYAESQLAVEHFAKAAQ